MTSKHIVDGFLAETGATVCDCLDCGCLVVGGPTRCIRCAKEGPPRQHRWKFCVGRLEVRLLYRGVFDDD